MPAQWITPLAKQTWVVSACLLALLAHGMSLGLSSSLIPALNAPDSTIKMDLEISSWYVASTGLATLVAYSVSPTFMDHFGRRTTYAIDLLPGIAGMILTSCAPDVYSLIIGKVLDGLTGGSSGVLGAVVIGEYTSPENRPMFLNLKTAAFYLGSTIVHILGNFFHWRTVAVICAVPYIVALGIVYTWPESPSWLAEKKKFKRSEESFFWLRGETDDSIREINKLIKAQSKIVKNRTFCEKSVLFLKKFTKKNFLKPAFIFFFGAILIETSGRHIFPAYADQIMSEIAGGTARSFYYTLTIDLIITCSALFSSYLVRVLKIRTVLFSSGAAALVVLIVVCLYLFLCSRGIILNYSPISLTLFAAYYILVNFGCAPIPLSFIGEIFPLEHRAVGSSLCGYMIGICMIVALKIMPYMLESLKIYGTFGVLALCKALALIVLFVMLPETKNKTLQDIEDYFNYGNYKGGDETDTENENMIKSETIPSELSVCVK